ncbi:MAG TPA: hypothetical protein ENJ95_12005 [Bacteroidetes bacterium]|nr:hypothetical protein [Bacteroidota bacterium]
MIRLSILFLLAAFSSGMMFFDKNYYATNTDCYEVLKEAKKNSNGCGFMWQANYMVAVDCFEENGNYEGALKVVDRFVYDVDGNALGSSIFLEKYAQLIRKIYSQKEIEDELNKVKIDVEIEGFFASIYRETDFEATLDKGSDNGFLYTSLELFGKRFSIIPDNDVLKNYLNEKIDKSDLEKYFQNRWLNSALYQALTK